MSIKVNEISSANSCQCPQPKVAFRGEEAPVDMEQKPDTFEKEGMSTGKKAAIGIGSLIGLVAVGFGIKKYLNRAVKFGVDEIKRKINKDDIFSVVLCKRTDKSAKLFEKLEKKVNYALVFRKNDGKTTIIGMKGEPSQEVAALLKEKNGEVISGNLYNTDLFRPAESIF